MRDPLLALGCCDPAARLNDSKRFDAHRQAIADLFAVWMEKHGDRPVAIRDLNEAVRNAADPHGRGRQFLVCYLGRLVGTRLNGFVLTRQEASGRWSAASFALARDARSGRA